MKRLIVLGIGALLALSTAVAKDKKKDPDEIGNRDVGKGVNFYSLEKEIALGKQLAQEVERVFRLLGLLYPHQDLHSAYFGIQSKDPVIHDNALEFLDNVLKPQLRNMLVPLLDSAVTIEERVKLANQYVGREVQSREEAVAELIASDDPWLKSCGAYAIGTLGLKSLAHELDNCMDHHDPLLREAARQAKLRLAGAEASD